MKISTALLYIIYKHNENRHNKITMPDLANYVKKLLGYDVLEVGEDGLSFDLGEKGLDRLMSSGLLGKYKVKGENYEWKETRVN